MEHHPDHRHAAQTERRVIRFHPLPKFVAPPPDAGAVRGAEDFSPPGCSRVTHITFDNVA